MVEAPDEILTGGEGEADAHVGAGRGGGLRAADYGADVLRLEAVVVDRRRVEILHLEADGVIRIARRVELAAGDEFLELVVGRELVADLDGPGLSLGRFDASPQDDAVRSWIAGHEALRKDAGDVFGIVG